jgi:hypothetical protein
MIIHQTREQLQQLVVAIDKFPIEGQSLQDVVTREYYRQKTKAAMVANMAAPTQAVNTDTPTTLIDNGWGLRLGLIRG